MLSAVKRTSLDKDGMNVALFLESSTVWVGTMLLTPEFVFFVPFLFKVFAHNYVILD